MDIIEKKTKKIILKRENINEINEILEFCLVYL